MEFASFSERTTYFSVRPQLLPRVLVLYGGETNEREVSIESGQAVAEGLRAGGVQVVEYEVSAWQELVHEVMKLNDNKKFDVVFNLIHGGFGEDGVVHAFLDMLAIPYVGSNHFASSLAMHKATCKKIWADSILNVPKAHLISSVKEISSLDALFFPCIVKPANEGSSNGITKVVDRDGLIEAVLKALEYDHQVLIEQFIAGTELTVAVIDHEAMTPIEIFPATEIYDYHAKYVAEDTQFFCPPKSIDSSQFDVICEQALLAYQMIGVKHWGRVDFIVDKDNRAWILEINLIPGMTSHSLVPQAAKEKGISFPQLVCGLVSLTNQGD